MKMKQSSIIVFAAAILVFAACFAAAQTAETMMRLAVHAQDASGKPIENLMPSALTLQVNKQSKSILDVVPTDIRQYVIVFDLAFASPEGIAAARQAAWNLLTSMKRTDVAAIAVYDLHSGVRLQCGFTSDRNQWIYALNRLEQRSESKDAGGFYFSDDVRANAPETLLDFSAVQPAIVKVSGLPAKMKIEKGADDFSTKLTAFAKSLSVVNGEKEIVFFSPGIPSRKAVAEISEEEDRDLGGTMLSGGADGEVEDNSPESPGRKESGGAAQLLGDVFMASDCVVYSFDLSRAGKPAASGTDYLKTIAKHSGGSYFDDLSHGIEQLKALPTRSWVIAWRDMPVADQVNEIKINGQAVKIHAPDKFLAPPPLLKFNELEKKLYFSQWLYSDVAVGKLQHTEFVDYFPLDKNLAKTIFFLQIPGAQLINGKSKMRSFYIYGYTSRPDGQLIDYAFTPVRIDTGKTGDQLKKAGVRYFDTFVSSPGDYRFTGAIVDIENNEATAFGFPFNVPDFQDLVVTRPVIASTDKDWISIRHEYSNDKKRGVEVTYPYGGKQGIFFPEVTPALHNGATYYLYYCVYNLAVDTSAQPPKPHPQLQFSLKPDQGEPTPIGDIALADRTAISDDDFGLLFEFKIPHVNAGDYKLVAEVIDGVAKKKTSRQLPVHVQ